MVGKIGYTGHLSLWGVEKVHFMCSMVSSGFDGFSMLYFNILGYYEVSRNFVLMGGCCGKIRKSRTGLIDFEKGMIMWKKGTNFSRWCCYSWWRIVEVFQIFFEAESFGGIYCDYQHRSRGVKYRALTFLRVVQSFTLVAVNGIIFSVFGDRKQFYQRSPFLNSEKSSWQN